MKVNKILFGVIEAIVFAVYNLIVFILTPNLTATFWVAYAFTVLSFVSLACVIVFNSTNKDNVIYGFSIYAVNIAYLVLQIVAGSILIIFSAISVKITIVSEVVLLSVFLVIALCLLLGKGNGQKLDGDTKDKVLFMKLLSNDIAVLRDKTTDTTIFSRLEDLKDAIDSSDPMSHTSLALVDQKISNKIANLSDIVSANDAVKVGEAIDEIEQVLAERNRKCKILK